MNKLSSWFDSPMALYLGSAVVTIPVVVGADLKIKSAQSAYSAYLEPALNHYPFAAFSFMALIALMMTSFERRHRLLRTVVQHFRHFAYLSFSSIAGTIAGVGVACCLVLYLRHGNQALALMAVTGFGTVQLTLTPMVLARVLNKFLDQDVIIRPISKKLLRLLVLVSVAVFGLSAWFAAGEGLHLAEQFLTR